MFEILYLREDWTRLPSVDRDFAPPWQIARNSSFLFRAMYQCFREHRLRESTILFRSGLDNGRSALAARSA